MICNWTLLKEKLFIIFFCFFQALNYIVDLLQMLWIDFVCIDTHTRIFFPPLVQKETAFYQTCFSHHRCLMYTFRDCFFFFFCRRGVTSLSSVSTRQTSYSHSKLTHLQPENILRPLCCVSVFVLIKILVLTCNKRKIILYFVGCSEFLITIFCFSLHVLQFKHFFAPSHSSISP